MKEKPELNGNYELVRPWIHPKDRDLPKSNFDNDIQAMREANPSRFKDGLDECTFGPQTNRTPEKFKERNYDDLLAWGDEKRFKHANARLGELNKDHFDHTPELDYNSVRIVGDRDGAVEDRLLKSGKDYSSNVDRKLKLEKDNMFSPAINQKSRELAAGFRPDELVKKDNGKTVNVDFWEAIPGERGDGTLYCRSLAKKRERQRATQIEAEMQAMKQKLLEEENAKKKGYDPIPMYTSPYCKELLNTDIPLKTIINRSKKVNSKNIAKYKQTLAASRSKSRSHSKSKSGSKSMRGVVVTGFESNHSHQQSPSKSPNKSQRSAASPEGKSRSKSKSISKALGVGKSRRKQLKDKTEAELRDKLLKEIKDEHNRSKS